MLIGASAPETETESVLTSAQIIELQEIITMLFDERLAEESRSAESQTDSSSRVDFRLPENLHLHPYFNEYTTDGRFALLAELHDLFAEAEGIRSERSESSGNTIISMIGMPCDDEGVFTIAFAHEKYFEFLGFISEFTGIAQDKFNVEVMIIVPAVLHERERR
jgi:hypothetical protein